jgi:phosphatidylserine decarboxylase
MSVPPAVAGRVDDEHAFQADSRFSLRLSAYLCVLCVENALNAENAEIRRGPQRNSLNSDKTIGFIFRAFGAALHHFHIPRRWRCSSQYENFSGKLGRVSMFR